jgi:hypothetical protein
MSQYFAGSDSELPIEVNRFFNEWQAISEEKERISGLPYWGTSNIVELHQLASEFDKLLEKFQETLNTMQRAMFETAWALGGHRKREIKKNGEINSKNWDGPSIAFIKEMNEVLDVRNELVAHLNQNNPTQ